jgi:methionine biosynthesis protein MetW
MKTLYDLAVNLVPKGLRVLDLGCGDGTLLERLIKERNCFGYGIEIQDENVLACIQKDIEVIQLNLEEGLALIEDNAFDLVLQINTLQHIRNTAVMLKESARIGKKVLVAFPNFAHWPNRLSVVKGRMPVTKTLPYEWYDTPNIRVGTFTDFKNLVQKNGLRVVDGFGLNKSGEVRYFANWRASTAIFLLERA